jgi:hypothetical protein
VTERRLPIPLPGAAGVKLRTPERLVLSPSRWFRTRHCPRQRARRWPPGHRAASRSATLWLSLVPSRHVSSIVAEKGSSAAEVPTLSW